VYALDFTDQVPGTVVLDKIQSKAPERYLPETLLRALVHRIGAEAFRAAGARVLAPASSVSNSSWVRECFAGATRHRKRVSFVMGAEERFFESSRQVNFVVLAEPSLRSDRGFGCPFAGRLESVVQEASHPE